MLLLEGSGVGNTTITLPKLVTLRARHKQPGRVLTFHILVALRILLFIQDSLTLSVRSDCAIWRFEHEGSPFFWSNYTA
jgi:hypothetical protein